MVRTLVLTCVCGLLVSAGQAGDGPPANASKRADLEAKLKLLGARFGPDHPEVRDVEIELQRVAASAQPFSKGPLVVLSKSNANYTLKDADVRIIGGRSFIVGVEIKSDITKTRFEGQVIWIPLDDVTEMIELQSQEK